MKVMLGCNQDRVYIDRADELYVPWSRRDLIEIIHTQYPNKTIMLDITEGDIENDELKMYVGLCRGNLKLLTTYDYYENEKMFNRVLSYPMNSIYEMQIAYEHGISEFYLGTELIHQLDKVSKFKKRTKSTIRVRANIFDAGHENEILDQAIGSYVLPQDLNLDLVNEVIDYIEFVHDDVKQEAAYYRIYIQDKEWPGKISQLILGYGSDNLVRMMEPIESRFRCNMSCLNGSYCKICYRNIDLADPSLYKYLKEKAQD